MSRRSFDGSKNIPVEIDNRGGLGPVGLAVVNLHIGLLLWIVLKPSWLARAISLSPIGSLGTVRTCFSYSSRLGSLRLSGWPPR